MGGVGGGGWLNRNRGCCLNHPRLTLDRETYTQRFQAVIFNHIISGMYGSCVLIIYITDNHRLLKTLWPSLQLDHLCHTESFRLEFMSTVTFACWIKFSMLEGSRDLNNARFTPNRDLLRTDLRVEKFWISRTREQSLNFYCYIRSQVSVYIDVGERLTYKKCTIGQVIRVTCDRTTTDLRAYDPHTPFVSVSA